MSDRKRQQRAALIVGGAAVGGLAIIGLAIALSSGDGDDKNSIDTSRTTTSSSSTSSSSTSTSTTTLITLPPTLPITTTPPTTAFFPTTAPPTQPPTQPTIPPTTATTQPPVTTTTTKPPTPAQQLATDLGTALNGGVPPEPGQNRVSVMPLSPTKPVVVTWKLNTALTPDEQATTARQEAFLLLQNIQTANPEGDDTLRLRATIPDPDGTGTDIVVRLVIDRAAFNAFDFTGVDPLTVFELPFVTAANIDEDVVPPVPGTTTSSSSTTSTTDPGGDDGDPDTEE